jgi:hypothetical protein
MRTPRAFPPQATFRPEDYGAVGDGTADDTQAFRDMHAAIMAAQDADPGVRVTIEFAPDADYTYTWNRWTWGIEYLTVEGNNASITNTSSGPEWDDAVVWQTNAPAVEIDGENRLGFKIDTAEKGASTVSLKDAAHAAEFEIGKWVLVASYSQQEMGWPPNARNFDYAKVVAIEDGKITLDRALQDTHRDDFPTRGDDDEIDVARLIPAERNVAWAEDWLIKDLTVLRNPNWPSGAAVQIEGFNKLVMDNVDIFHYSAGQGNELILRNSRLPSAEPDKLLETLTIENSEANLLLFATGVDKLNFINSESDQFWFAGRHLNIEGSTFNHSGPDRQWDPIMIGGSWSVESVEMTDTVINGQNHEWQPAMKGGWINRLTIGDGFALEGDDLVVTDPHYFDGIQMHNRMYEGQYLQLEDASQNPIGYGQVQSITSNGGPLTARIDVDWSITPEEGMVVAQHNTAKLIAKGMTLNDTFLNPDWSADTAYMVWNGKVLHDPLWLV